MRSKIVILTLVGLTAGAFGTLGSRILAESGSPTAAGDTGGIQARRFDKANHSSDACRELARTVSKRSMSDARLERLLKRNRDCRALVIDSNVPAGMNPGTRIVTLPATTQDAPASTVAQPYDEGDDYDDEYEEEDEHEDEHEDEDEDEHEEDD